jgi:hypothetical protein
MAERLVRRVLYPVSRDIRANGSAGEREALRRADAEINA